MTDKIVGSEGCSFTAVFNAMNTPENVATLSNDWHRFARLLDETSDFSMMDMQYKMGLLSVPQLYEKVLQTWRGKAGDNATLLELIQALEKGNFRGLADSLRTKFRLRSITDVDGDDSFDELDRQKEFVDRNLPRLKNLTSINSSLIAELVVAKMWSDDNSEILESLPVKGEKIRYLYYEIAKHRGGLVKLTEILRKGKQSGAAEVFEKFD